MTNSLRATKSALAALLLWVGLAIGSASAASLSVDDLLRLAGEGVGEPVLLSLVEHQGVQGPLTADQVLAMSRAGLGDELLAAIVAAAARPGGDGAGAAEGSVTYEERDGAVVAYSRGTPEEPQPETGSRAPAEPATAPAPAAPPYVIVQAAPAPEPQGAQAGSNPHPVGAVHGWSGSTVFLPARFGGNPSAFGRTIVTNDPGYRSVAPAPYWGGVVTGPSPAPTSSYGTTTIRTSRGPRRIPN